MFNKIGNIIIAVWMSLLLLFGGISTELLHQFAHHKDGIDPDRKGLVFEKRHHHCSFLGFSLSPFTNNFQLPVIICLELSYAVLFYTVSKDPLGFYRFHAYLRGPPSRQ